MTRPALTLVFASVYVLVSVTGLSLEKAYDTTDLPDHDGSTTTKIVKINNGIRFENGILIHSSSDESKLSSTTTTTTTTESVQEEYEDKIVFTEEAIKVMEMLTDNVAFVKATEDLNKTKPVQHNYDNIDHYHNYEELQEMVYALVSNYPQLVSNYSLGKSVQGREIIALKIRTNVNDPRPVGVPMVKYVGNMHGDESVGREMIIAMAEYLVANYEEDDRITDLLNNTEIHLVPSMNPDGFEAVSRGNYNQVDLNRAFPGQNLLDKDRNELVEDREPEVVALIDWILENPFVVSINFHDGAVVANYPWDQFNRQPWLKSDRFQAQTVDEKSAATPDNSEFIMLSKLYSGKHATMNSKDHYCGKFEDGITNGAEWYEVAGGMQDFNYLFTNCMEITLELSCVKKPLAKMLQTEWENNKESMLSYLEVAKSVLHGVVSDSDGNPVKDAHIHVSGRGKDVLTTDQGEYWRILSPGSYRVKAMKGDMMSAETSITIGNDWRTFPGQKLDLVLTVSNPRSVTTPSTTAPTTTSTTTTTTEPDTDGGTNLYVLPGICVNIALSFPPIRGCKERNNG